MPITPGPVYNRTARLIKLVDQVGIEPTVTGTVACFTDKRAAIAHLIQIGAEPRTRTVHFRDTNPEWLPQRPALGLIMGFEPILTLSQSVVLTATPYQPMKPILSELRRFVKHYFAGSPLSPYPLRTVLLGAECRSRTHTN
jgi:hypothetical protein